MLEVDRLDRIEGLNVRLRLITSEDANYIFGLRTNPAYNRYLSAVRGTAKDQQYWIESYKTREAKGVELYYVIERKDGQRCGVVRLYEIGTTKFTWGSWILDHNKPPKAALESALLSFAVGFRYLLKELALIDVRVANEKAIDFYRRLGMTEIQSDEINLYFTYPRNKFEADLDRYTLLLADSVNMR